MAISKLILNGETQMDVTSNTNTSNNMLSGVVGTKNDGTSVTGNIVSKSSTDLTVSGATVTAPAGYYANAASKAVATTTHPNPTASITSSTGVVTASHTQTAGYVTSGTTTGTLNLTTQAATTYNTSTADQTIASNRWLTGVQTIKSVTTSNLTAANIAEGVVVKVGDSSNASRIIQVTGTHSGGGGGGYTVDQIAMRTISGVISGSATTIGSYAFCYCSALTTASFPSATIISTYAFTSCFSLTTASFPSATSIGGFAFYSCSALTTASFPNVISIGNYAFQNCYSLTTASFPKATYIGMYTFNYCTKLTTVSFPSATIISSYAFASCSSLTTASFPSATIIGNNAFNYCTKLTTASFPNVTSIGNYAFRSCFNLLSFYLLGSSIPTLGTSVFSSTPIGGYTTSTGDIYGSIFVPSSLYNSYLTATNWSLYSARIVSV